MNSRERVLTAVTRGIPDRVPVYLWLTPHVVEGLRRERGADDVEAYFGMDIRMVDYRFRPEEGRFDAYTGHYPPGTTVDRWGCGTYPVGYFHFTKAVCPLEGCTSVEAVEAYPFPQCEPDRPALRRAVREVQDAGLAACSQYECGTFEQGHALLGMEGLLQAFYTHPEMVVTLFERISDVKARMAAAYAEAGVDLLFIGDDIGFQDGPAMDPAVWREFLLPPLRKIIAAARSVRPDIPVAYHSCGYVEFAVEGLIDAGVTVLQSVQPEANDVALLKDRYGDRIAFWGGAGSQSTLSHGTPAEVRDQVRSLMGTLGRQGGYICSPAHFVEPESPLENLDAFRNALREFGGYA